MEINKITTYSAASSSQYTPKEANIASLLYLGDSYMRSLYIITHYNDSTFRFICGRIFLTTPFVNLNNRENVYNVLLVIRKPGKSLIYSQK